MKRFLVYSFIFVLCSNLSAQKPHSHNSTFIKQSHNSPQKTYMKNNMKIDAELGIPVAIYNLNYGPLSGTPEEMARQYLLENHRLFKMSPVLSEIVTEKVEEEQEIFYPCKYHIGFI